MYTGKIIYCSKCDAKYELHEFHTMFRDQDSVSCEVCHTDLFFWNGASIFTLDRITEEDINNENKL